MQGGTFEHDEQAQLLALQSVGALAALLRHAVRNMPDVHPDGVRVTLDTMGLQVEFTAGDHTLTAIGFDA